MRTRCMTGLLFALYALQGCSSAAEDSRNSGGSLEAPWIVTELAPSVQTNFAVNMAAPLEFIAAMKEKARRDNAKETHAIVPLRAGWMCYIINGGVRERSYDPKVFKSTMEEALRSLGAKRTRANGFSILDEQWLVDGETMRFLGAFAGLDIATALHDAAIVKARLTNDGDPGGFLWVTISGASSATQKRRAVLSDIERRYAALPAERFHGNCTAADMKTFKDVTKPPQ